jgi:O-antigen/teichoic acid export membrane protein
MKFQEITAHWRRARQSAMFFGIFATGVKVGANLLLLPILLSKLPEADLALWWLFGALGGFANLADFGFGATIARVYSYLWAGAEDFDAEGLRPPPVSREPNLPRIRQLSATVGYFYWLLAIAATLVIAVIGTFLLRKTVAAVADPRLAWMAWAGQVFLIGYGLGTSRWMLACQGLGRMREVQAAYLFGGLTYVALATVLLLNGWGLLGLLAATFARELIARNYCRWVYHAAVPKVSALHVKPDKEILKRLWPNASKLGVLSIGSFLLSNGSVLISGQLKDVSVTASFGLTAQIGGFLTNFAALWLVVKWPVISMLRIQGRLQEMSILFARRLAFTMGTYVVLATLVVLIGNWLLALKGTHTRLLPAPLLIFYFIYLAQQLFYVQFGALAYSENVVPFFKIGILTGMGMFILSFLMTWAFGLWGMLLAPLIAESAYSSWFTVRRGFRGQPLTARELLKAAVYGHP